MAKSKHGRKNGYIPALACPDLLDSGPGTSPELLELLGLLGPSGVIEPSETTVIFMVGQS